MKQLLEAGVHFGHQTSRWNPKMKPFIFGARNGIHIIDLQQTVVMFREACDFVRETVSKGGSVLFVGTKKQAQESIRKEASRCGQLYVNNRWLGGTLTNFQTIRQSIDRLNRLEETLSDDGAGELTKKERLFMQRDVDKLHYNLEGVREMKKLPDVMFVIDPAREEIAVQEANRLNIPVIAVVDTNCDPGIISYCIPGNDDAIRAIRLFCGAIADAVVAGQEELEERRRAGDAAAPMGVTGGPLFPAFEQPGETSADAVAVEGSLTAEATTGEDDAPDGAAEEPADGSAAEATPEPADGLAPKVSPEPADGSTAEAAPEPVDVEPVSAGNK